MARKSKRTPSRTRSSRSTTPKREKPRRTTAPEPSLDKMRKFVRREAVRFLDVPNINSVGIGIKHKPGSPLDNNKCIQFTVDRKMAPESLESVGSRMIPATFEIDGKLVPTDVVQRRFKCAFEVLPEAFKEPDPRKSRRDVLQPGLSISHPKGTAGTLGAIVYDRSNGQPLMLSNWHVLHTSRGAIGDTVVQPGPHDDNRLDGNLAGKLLRSHLGAAGDCAVATIEGRATNPEVIGLKGVIPARLGRAELGDTVVKSGRTTAVTWGRVTRIEVQTRMEYDDRAVIVGGFEIGPHPRHLPGDGEISKGGDSGSAWMAVDPANQTITDIMLGLHFAGESSEQSPEFALACNAEAVFEKLAVSLLPPPPPPGSSPAEVPPRAAPRPGRQPASATASAAGRTFGGDGYDDNFLGTRIALPTPTATTRRDIVGAERNGYTHYTHFSLAMRASRRLCAVTAWNINAEREKPSINKKIDWDTDPRLPQEVQIGNELYADTDFDRGHIAKREDLVWGPKSEAKRANDDSFCYTNSTPQHHKFNRHAPALWKSLEDEIYQQADVANGRVTLFGGPIFRPDDREFLPKAAPRGTKPVRIPREYYKIVAYRDAAAGRVKAHAFILSQADLIRGKLEALAAESLDLVKFKMYQVTVAEIEQRIGFAMPDMRRLDTKLRGPAGESLEPRAVPTPRLIERFSDIL